MYGYVAYYIYNVRMLLMKVIAILKEQNILHNYCTQLWTTEQNY